MGGRMTAGARAQRDGGRRGGCKEERGRKRYMSDSEGVYE